MKKLDLLSFNQAKPFETLDPRVNSDHAPILFSINEFSCGEVGSIFSAKAWNISNGEYHKYFATGPFAKTHMNVTKPDPWLVKKEEMQIQQIISDLGTFNMQIVIEGYYSFYTELMKRLAGKNIELVSILKTPDHGMEGSSKNITGILVEQTRILKVIDSGIDQISYKEYGSPEKLTVPWTKITRKFGRDNEHTFIVVAVHLPGHKYQFPKTGLRLLNNFVKQLQAIHRCNIYAIGDFNTVPENILLIMKKGIILPPRYPTHINPNSEVVVYDNVVYFPYEYNHNIYPEIDNRPDVFAEDLICLYESC